MKQFIEEQMKKPLTPEQIARQDKWIREGMQFFDKALALAPREAELYLQRAVSRFGAHTFKDMSSIDKGNFDIKTLLPPLLKDVETAFALDDTDIRVIGFLVLIALLQRSQGGETSTDVLFERALQRLQTILDKNKSEIMTFAPLVSVVYMIQKKTDKALDFTRKAQAQLSEAACRADNCLGQLELVLLLSEERVEEAKICVERLLKYDENASFLRILAKIQVRSQKKGEALQLLRKALVKETKAPLTLLALASVLLQESATRPAAFAEADGYLTQVASLPTDALDSEQRRYYYTTSAVMHLLQGNLEQGKVFIKKIQEIDSDSDALKVLKEIVK
jgi:tetratricopeptide (TPR) repeat protein